MYIVKGNQQVLKTIIYDKVDTSMKLIKFLFYTIFLLACVISFYAFFYDLPPPQLNTVEEITIENDS
tara:strand:+ start:248 stop:448 length:201 start_codon:yes stop_codon:yes gene_type:complete